MTKINKTNIQNYPGIEDDENTTSGVNIEIPEDLISSFGTECKKYGVANSNGIFDDPHKLVDLSRGKLKIMINSVDIFLGDRREVLSNFPDEYHSINFHKQKTAS